MILGKVDRCCLKVLEGADEVADVDNEVIAWGNQHKPTQTNTNQHKGRSPNGE